MVHATHVENVQRLPDVLGRPLLAGVRNGEEALGPGAVEDAAELLGRVAGFPGVKPDSDDRVAVRQRSLERRHGRLGAEVAQEAHDQP